MKYVSWRRREDNWEELEDLQVVMRGVQPEGVDAPTNLNKVQKVQRPWQIHECLRY
jgi:hypothetical protein